MSNPEVSGSSLRCDIEQGIPMYRDVRFAPISNFEGEMLHFIQHDNDGPVIDSRQIGISAALRYGLLTVDDFSVGSVAVFSVERGAYLVKREA